MDAEIKAQWLAALRSGDYSQGDGQLRIAMTEEGGSDFCCLGVLCDIVEPMGWRPILGDDDEFQGWSHSAASEVLAESFARKVGLTHERDNGTVVEDTDPLILVRDILALDGISKRLRDYANNKMYAQRRYRGDEAFPVNVSLSSLNDDGFSFGEIANIIEALL